MQDQARALRRLMEHRSQAIAAASVDSASTMRSQVITVTSGKGGVGKSNVALNLAIALAEAEQSVLLLDVNWGVGNIELLCRLNLQWNLSHVLAGGRRLDEILVSGPAGVTMVPGVGSLAEHPEDSSAALAVSDLLMMLQQQFRFVIVDLGVGLHRSLRQFLANSDRVLVLTTTEPPSLAEAYATIKSLSPVNPPEWEVLINQAATGSEAETIFQRLYQTTRAFLQKDLGWAGWIPQDAHVPKAVACRSPFLLEHPHCPASEAVRQTARRLIEQARMSGRPAFPFSRSQTPAPESWLPAAVP